MPAEVMPAEVPVTSASAWDGFHGMDDRAVEAVAASDSGWQRLRGSAHPALVRTFTTESGTRTLR
jgi:hypothetical protein